MESVRIFYRAIREVGVDLDCRMIPVHTYWAGHLEKTGIKPAEILQADELLPNERGRAVIAVIAAVHLETILRQISRSTFPYFRYCQEVQA